jgi:hypothetical protein
MWASSDACKPRSAAAASSLARRRDDLGQCVRRCLDRRPQRAMAGIGPGVGEGPARLGKELPAIALWMQRESQDPRGVAVMHLAVGLGPGDAVVLLAARSDNELPGPASAGPAVSQQLLGGAEVGCRSVWLTVALGSDTSPTRATAQVAASAPSKGGDAGPDRDQRHVSLSPKRRRLCDAQTPPWPTHPPPRWSPVGGAGQIRPHGGSRHRNPAQLPGGLRWGIAAEHRLPELRGSW